MLRTGLVWSHKTNYQKKRDEGWTEEVTHSYCMAKYGKERKELNSQANHGENMMKRGETRDQDDWRKYCGVERYGSSKSMVSERMDGRRGREGGRARERERKEREREKRNCSWEEVLSGEARQKGIVLCEQVNEEECNGQCHDCIITNINYMQNKREMVPQRLSECLKNGREHPHNQKNQRDASQIRKECIPREIPS